MSLIQILEWFLWGFFMGAGWFVSSWLMGKLFSKVG